MGSNPLCAYKHIFGKEKEGVHSIRIFDIAVIDLLLTVIAAGVIAYLSKINFVVVLILLLLLGIAFHRAFCVNTTVNRAIFGVI